jgi:hypothetical protein
VRSTHSALTQHCSDTEAGALEKQVFLERTKQANQTLEETINTLSQRINAPISFTKEKWGPIFIRAFSNLLTCKNQLLTLMEVFFFKLYILLKILFLQLYILFLKLFPIVAGVVGGIVGSIVGFYIPYFILIRPDFPRVWLVWLQVRAAGLGFQAAFTFHSTFCKYVNIILSMKCCKAAEAESKNEDCLNKLLQACDQGVSHGAAKQPSRGRSTNPHFRVICIHLDTLCPCCARLRFVLFNRLNEVVGVGAFTSDASHL